MFGQVPTPMALLGAVSLEDYVQSWHAQTCPTLILDIKDH